MHLDVSERLHAIANAWPRAQQPRFRKAVDRAANLLELDAPAVLGFGPEGHPFAGIYSTVGRGRMVIVLAGAMGAMSVAMRVADINAAREAARKFRSEQPDLPIPLVIDFMLRERATSDVGLGILLDVDPDLIRYIQQLDAAGAVPAFVALLAKDRKSSIRFVLPHGIAWTGLEMAEPQGRA
jgi:hypothetical protein